MKLMKQQKNTMLVFCGNLLTSVFVFDFEMSICSLPIKHCLLNPVELAWAGLKRYVRDNNVNFRLSDVQQLAHKWMLDLKPTTVTGYLNHVYKIEETFKKSDNFTEQLEEDLLDDDDDEELDSEAEDMPD